MGLLFREPKKPDGHPLLGHMHETTVDDIREMLTRRPPTPEEADLLAIEELTCWDRSMVFHILASYLPKERWPE